MNDFQNNIKSEYPNNTDTGKFLAEQPNQVASTTDNYEYTYEELGLPPNPELSSPVYDYVNGLSYFAFSQCGESHIKKGAVCQDRCAVRVSGSFIVAAIADGVGSCALSDYGSDIAVNRSAEYLEEHLTGENCLDKSKAEKLLKNAMQYAYDEVDNFAEKHEQMLFSFQSTLTIAIYDGDVVYFGHAGDDGIVACTRNGQLEMITKRHKGEEASSVYPLQSVSTWEFGEYKNVSSFVMATDGVLDSFVMSEFEDNRIYYSFIQTAVESPMNSIDDVSAICHSYYELMASQSYRKRVTDDLTFVAVTNQNKRKKTKFPNFDIAEWNRKTEEYSTRRNANLYSQTSNRIHLNESRQYQTSYSGNPSQYTRQNATSSSNSGYFQQGNLYSGNITQYPPQNPNNGGGYSQQESLYSNSTTQYPNDGSNNDGCSQSENLYSSVKTEYPSQNETGDNVVYYRPQNTFESKNAIQIPPTSSQKQDNDMIHCPYCGLRQAKGRFCQKCGTSLINSNQGNSGNSLGNPKTKKTAKSNDSKKKKKGKSTPKHKSNTDIVSGQKPKSVSKKGTHSESRKSDNKAEGQSNIFLRFLNKFANFFRAEVEDE